MLPESIPALPFFRLVYQYAVAKNLPFLLYKDQVKAAKLYCLDCEILN